MEKVQDIGDLYIYELCTLQADFLPPVRSTDIYNYLLSTSFVRVKGLRHTRAWTPTSILPVSLSAKLEEKYIVGDYFVVVSNVSCCLNIVYLLLQAYTIGK